ncbi:MAG: hypothetical protein J5524_11110 [Bacteroidaceae bacterium]|nr:hypothetical protein [Bacteroidaceae bacterium]
MKKYILAVFAGLLLASCDTDNIAALYETNAQNISFENEEPATVVTKASEITLPVTLMRSNTKGTYTAHYTLETADEGIFTDKSEGVAVFADGEWKTTITVDAANMQGGTLYSFTLTLSDEDIETTDTILGKSNNILTTVSVMCDYDWEELGTGYYNSELFEEGWDQPVYRAVGTNIYKLPDCLYKGYDIQFELSEDGNSLVNFEPQQMGYKHGTYGMVYFYAEEMEREGNTIKFPMYGLVMYNGQLATLWSGFTESITLPE